MKEKCLSKDGYLILELMVGLATMSLCSMFMAQWYMQVMSEEKKMRAGALVTLELASLAHTIKAGKLPLTGKQGDFSWTSHPFGAGLCGHWVTIHHGQQVLLCGVL